MKKIRLLGTDISTTSIGFGCAGLMRTITSMGRQRILSETYDAGIRHFDVARMYGLGCVEKEVGKFIRDRRDDVVIATKYGIEAPVKCSYKARTFYVLRRAINVIPGARKIIKRKSSGLIQNKSFDGHTARESLIKSLRELNTDYVDIFFLHEPTINALVNIGETYEALMRMKDEGLIRAFGIAGYLENNMEVFGKSSEIVQVFQVDNDILHKQIDEVRNVYKGPIISFSPFSRALKIITDYVYSSKERCNLWTSIVGIDCRKTENIAALLLKYSIESNPDGVSLFSTSKAGRIHAICDKASKISTADSLLPFIDLVDRNIYV